jgi:purine-binding chemotaxis protein CheW
MSDNTTLQYLTFGLGEEVFALETGACARSSNWCP